MAIDRNERSIEGLLGTYTVATAPLLVVDSIPTPITGDMATAVVLQPDKSLRHMRPLLWIGSTMQPVTLVQQMRDGALEAWYKQAVDEYESGLPKQPN